MKISVPLFHLFMREDPENGLAFVGPEDAMQADEKEKSSVVLVIKGPCG